MSSQNPDTRPLPPGWISQYDSNYRAWFYVNTGVQPPVTTWVHPLGAPSQSPPPPPPPASYGPPSGPPPAPPASTGYERGPGYGYNSYGQPGPQSYGGAPGPYGGPPGPPGPPGPYGGPPPYAGYGGPSGGYPQYGGNSYPGQEYGRTPSPERGRGYGGGLFSGRQQDSDNRGQKKSNFGKVALGLGGAALGAFALKEFVDHKEDEAFDAGVSDGYNAGFDNGFNDGFVDGGDGIW